MGRPVIPSTYLLPGLAGGKYNRQRLSPMSSYPFTLHVRSGQVDDRRPPLPTASY